MAKGGQVSIGTESLEEERARGKQPNLRSIHVTEHGIWFDEAFIPHIAISTDVRLTAVDGRQQITLTVNADELTFQGRAHATIAVPDAGSSEAWPDTKERHESKRVRDENTLTGEHRVSETYSHIERDPEYLGVEDRTPRSRPAGFMRHTNEPCSTRPVLGS